MMNAYEIPVKWDIQRMIPEDLEEILSIETSSSLTPWSKNMFLNELENRLSHCFVIKTKALPHPALIGFICFRNVTGESELLNIGVHPDYRQMGVGKALMEFYITFCSQMGIKRYYLEVNSSNRSAIRLYQHFSYHSSGLRKKFYQGKFDALLMTKEG
jgi:ribosomal-protein-alanine N-acetyltransferase